MWRGSAAVDFDIEHRESFAQDLWLRLQAQRRRIVVRGDDAKTARRSLRQCEGDGGAVVCREKIAPARSERPNRRFRRERGSLPRRACLGFCGQRDTA